MKLAYAFSTEYHRPLVVALVGSKWIDLAQAMRAFPARFQWLASGGTTSLLEWLRNTPDLAAALKESLTDLQNSGELPRYEVPGDMRLLAPLFNPSKIVALGHNYAAHAAERGFAVTQEPTLFAKVASSIISPNDDIVYPSWVQRLDPEVELAVILGRRAKSVPEERAMDYVAGYTILNDVTARDVQVAAQNTGHPWFVAKSADTFCPLGPYLVLADEIADPHNLELTLRVGEQVRQHSNTGMMIFKIPYLIAYISQRITLEPGDIIATGTPEGIAPLQRGDVVECTVSGLGTLSNRVV